MGININLQLSNLRIVSPLQSIASHQQSRLSSLPIPWLQKVFSFLPFASICALKSTHTYFHEMRIENLSLLYTYEYGEKNNRFFNYFIKSLIKSNYSCSEITMEALYIIGTSLYPNTSMHEKDNWINGLAKHPIKHLKLSDFFLKLGAQGFEALEKISTLEELELTIQTVAPDFLRQLNKLRALRIKSIDENGLIILGQLTHLSWLFISNSSIASKAIKRLEKSRIKKLTFFFCERIKSDCFNYLKKLPFLEELNIIQCEKMENFCLKIDTSEFSSYEILCKDQWLFTKKTAEEELGYVAQELPRLIRFNGTDLSPYRAPAEVPPTTEVSNIAPKKLDAIHQTLDRPFRVLKDVENGFVGGFSSQTPASLPAQSFKPSNSLLNAFSVGRVETGTIHPPELIEDRIPAADVRAPSCLAQLCSAIAACFSRLWACIYACFCRRGFEPLH